MEPEQNNNNKTEDVTAITMGFDANPNPTGMGFDNTKNQDSSPIGDIANATLEIEQENEHGIKLSVCGHMQKGSGLTKYTVYLIRGEDKNGPIEVYRRFNEFFALREAMIERWPGCFVPAVPDKNALLKNDQQVIYNRERFLNDFVKKMSRLPHLYYGEQFQTLIRSKEVDISVVFEKWPKPSYDDIINKYRECFNQLAGKQINSQTSVKISSFSTFLKTSQATLPSYKDMAKGLALARQKYDDRLASLFTRILPDYEKTCLLEYVEANETLTVYGNSNNAKALEHGEIAKLITKKNPYWLLYDLIKQEQRDGQAFLEAIETRDRLVQKVQDVEIKIKENHHNIEQINMGKSTFKSLTSRGTKQEIKYRIELENQELAKEKDSLIVLTDIISALLAYITIDQYRFAKKKFYSQSFLKVTGYELNFVNNMLDIWTHCDELSAKMLQENAVRV